MFETWSDILRFGVAGAAGGLIYWAAREHGAVFAQLWSYLVRR